VHARSSSSGGRSRSPKKNTFLSLEEGWGKPGVGIPKRCFFCRRKNSLPPSSSRGKRKSSEASLAERGCLLFLQGNRRRGRPKEREGRQVTAVQGGTLTLLTKGERSSLLSLKGGGKGSEGGRYWRVPTEGRALLILMGGLSKEEEGTCRRTVDSQASWENQAGPAFSSEKRSLFYKASC